MGGGSVAGLAAGQPVRRFAKGFPLLTLARILTATTCENAGKTRQIRTFMPRPCRSHKPGKWGKNSHRRKWICWSIWFAQIVMSHPDFVKRHRAYRAHKPHRPYADECAGRTTPPTHR